MTQKFADKMKTTNYQNDCSKKLSRFERPGLPKLDAAEAKNLCQLDLTERHAK